MKLQVKRIFKGDTYTIGKLYINGDYFCDTLENKYRGLTQEMSIDEIFKLKVKDETAIPTGKYKITLNVYSPSFGSRPFYEEVCGGRLPRLLDVKGFSGILIHCGANINHTSGCILVGKNTIKGGLTDSKETFKALYDVLSSADEDIYITIS